ncbi:hypothetical protein M0805_003359 [Coniferiporia weirii]|nr:hypothetical protein M0805_003359 [Coniferiporia weirii]
MPSEPDSPARSMPPSFFKDELARALSEQTFGIVGYSLGRSSAYEACATVVLLERIQLCISLTIRGYQVTSVSALPEGPHPPTVSADATVVFETVDALLQQCSPLYSTKRTEAIFARLMS